METMRWFGKKAAVYVPDGGEVALEFHCRTPNLDKDPVILKVVHDGKLINTILFTEESSVKKTYELLKTPGRNRNCC